VAASLARARAIDSSAFVSRDFYVFLAHRIVIDKIDDVFPFYVLSVALFSTMRNGNCRSYVSLIA